MEKSATSENLIRELDAKTAKEEFTRRFFFSFLAVTIVVGTLVGFVLNQVKKSASNKTTGLTTAKAKQTAGIADKKTFKDKAEGILKEGGADGEGNFHLDRPGGESQNVYLTSTTVDLSQYIGKKVRVWGETFQAEKAGWLMDVGLVELLQ